MTMPRLTSGGRFTEMRAGTSGHFVGLLDAELAGEVR